MGMITKEFYQKCIEIEVYKSKKRLLRRVHSESARAILFLRKMQFYSGFRSAWYRRKLAITYGIFVHRETQIGLGLKLPHPDGIIIGKGVHIGDNVTIFQQVTIGSAHTGDWENGVQPVLGSNVTLFAGAKILGDIKVADGTTVGANAVLNKTTEQNTVWAGVPARCLHE